MSAAYDRPERSRGTPLTRMLMNGEVSMEKPQSLTSREKFDRWMINEGYRRLFVLTPSPPRFLLPPLRKKKKTNKY